MNSLANLEWQGGGAGVGKIIKIEQYTISSTRTFTTPGEKCTVNLDTYNSYPPSDIGGVTREDAEWETTAAHVGSVYKDVPPNTQFSVDVQGTYGRNICVVYTR